MLENTRARPGYNV